MKVKHRQALIWGGMFLLAFVGGRWLGGFVVAGVDINPMNQMAGFEIDPANEARNATVAVRSAERQFQDIGPVNCTGCDAGETRYRQMAEQMGLPVDEGGDAGQEHAGDEAVAAPAE